MLGTEFLKISCVFASHLSEMPDFVHHVDITSSFLFPRIIRDYTRYVAPSPTLPLLIAREPLGFTVYSLRRRVTAKARSYIPDSLAPPRGQAPLGLATLQAVDKSAYFYFCHHSLFSSLFSSPIWFWVDSPGYHLFIFRSRR